MLIQCTKALLDKMGIGKDELQRPEGHEQIPASFMAWHANLVNINRRKAIVLMNNATRYPVVIYRPRPKDFARIKDLIREGITTALRMEGVREDVVRKYLDDAGEIRFSKTASRSLVAKMNNAVNEVGFVQEYLDADTRIQRYISIITGRFIQNLNAEEGFYPIEKMLAYLSKYSGVDEKGNSKDVLEVDLYQLKIRIDLEGFDIWRRVLVPSTYSFRHLHNIIQTVFDWQNYHLHAFEAKKEGVKDKRIVMDDDPDTLECLDLDTYDVLLEQFVALEDIFPEYKEVTYEYDFGDFWEHTITLEKVIKSNTFAATYLEGKGERPPEDVGGAWGYAEYVRIMADDTDPEHEEMKIWAESQKQRNLSPEKINDRLRRVIRGHRYMYI